MEKRRAKTSDIDRRRQQLYASTLSLPGKIYWLLEDAKRYGTLPFAGLAWRICCCPNASVARADGRVFKE